ncbi:MAG: 6,7-dimethyl-8-ribityllumazine synthase [Magnetospirillum gryphiswaldense]|nr:6,7-dimethyl-8-ribityllumazine synthase [Magnetospirillum gryphiswaldense]
MSTNVLIIEARFYDHLADMLLNGAKGALEAAGAGYDVLTIPGVLEIPAALEYMVASGKPYDAFVVLGTAIQGESDHYGHVCTECFRGCTDLSLRHHLALGNGVLTVHNEAQALKRADPTRKNMGGQAARAALRMLEIKRELQLT